MFNPRDVPRESNVYIILYFEEGMAQKNVSHHVQRSFLEIRGAGIQTAQLPLVMVKGKEAGPHVWITAGIHGDESGAVVVAQELIARLSHTSVTKGVVSILPIVNPSGFSRVVRVLPESHEDINRCFPGDRGGSLGKQFADVVFQAIRRTNAAVVCDLHNGWTMAVPYVLIEPAIGGIPKKIYTRIVAFAKSSGLIIIEDYDEEDIDEESGNTSGKTLSESLVSFGFPALTFELGGSYGVDETRMKAYADSVWNIFASLGMVQPEKVQLKIPTTIRGKILKYTDRPRCSVDGIVRFVVSPGDIVKKGDELAHVYSEFGELLETLRAVQHSVILEFEDSAQARVGKVVIASGIEK